MINIKIFEKEEQYLTSEKVYPQVSHCLDTDNVWVEGEPIFNVITLKVKGLGSQPLFIYRDTSPGAQFVTSVMVDDIRQPSISPMLKLNDTAEHVVKIGMSIDCTTLMGFFCITSGQYTTSEIDFTNFDFTNVKDIGFLFGNNSVNNYQLKKIIWGDGTNMEKASFTNVVGLYCGCNYINNFNYNILSHSTATDYSYMFFNCRALTRLENFPWKNGLITIGMFKGCSSLSYVDLFSYTIDTRNCSEMFKNVANSGTCKVPSNYDAFAFNINIWSQSMQGPKNNWKFIK